MYFRISARPGVLNNDGEYGLEVWWNAEDREDLATTTRVRESARKPDHLLHFYTLTDEGREAFIERGARVVANGGRGGVRRPGVRACGALLGAPARDCASAPRAPDLQVHAGPRRGPRGVRIGEVCV